MKGIKKKRDIQKWNFMKNWRKTVLEDSKQNWHFKISQNSTGGQVHRIIDEILKRS